MEPPRGNDIRSNAATWPSPAFIDISPINHRPKVVEIRVDDNNNHAPKPTPKPHQTIINVRSTTDASRLHNLFHTLRADTSSPTPALTSNINPRIPLPSYPRNTRAAYAAATAAPWLAMLQPAQYQRGATRTIPTATHISPHLLIALRNFTMHRLQRNIASDAEIIAFVRLVTSSQALFCLAARVCAALRFEVQPHAAHLESAFERLAGEDADFGRFQGEELKYRLPISALRVVAVATAGWVCKCAGGEWWVNREKGVTGPGKKSCGCPCGR